MTADEFDVSTSGPEDRNKRGKKDDSPALGPVDEMVSNDKPMNPSICLQNVSGHDCVFQHRSPTF